jgi:type IV pilus assembly protein PilA
MARALHLPRRMAQRREQGFTLIELMIVVVIVAVLATLAVVGYRKLVTSSHVSEAQGMVQGIREAQEAYHAETQQYANLSPTIATYYPAATPGRFVTAWGGACASQCNAGMDWNMLPLHVDAPVLFGYATTAGQANTNPNPPTVTANGATITFPAPAPTDWYVIGSAGDSDGNSVFCNVYGSSFTNQVFVNQEGE